MQEKLEKYFATYITIDGKSVIVSVVRFLWKYMTASLFLSTQKLLFLKFVCVFAPVFQCTTDFIPVTKDNLLC